MGNQNRRKLPDIEGVTVERGVGPAREEAVPAHADDAPGLQFSFRELDAKLPQPRDPLSEGDSLIPEERALLEHCTKSYRELDSVFWARGRILETVYRGALWRDDYSSFDDFVVREFEIHKRRVYQLLETWQPGEALMAIIERDGIDVGLNEAKTRALLPVFVRHGDEAAAFVLRVVVEYAEGRTVTGTLLESVVATLPADRFERAEVEQLIKEHMAAGVRVLPAPKSPEASESAEEPVPIVDKELHRLQSAARRIARAAKKDPGVVHRFADELENLARQIRAAAGPPE
jgi:hypothetical protein